MFSPTLWASHILERLYLGGIHSSQNLPSSITHVISILSEKPHLSDRHVKRKHLFIKAADSKDQDLLSMFPVCYQFIQNALQENRTNEVLIHCHAGRSRSATIVLMYLMRRYRVTYKKAMKYLLQRRPLVQINEGFHEQLITFEDDLRKCKWNDKCTCTICRSEFGRAVPKAPIKMNNRGVRKSSSYENLSPLTAPKLEKSPSYEINHSALVHELIKTPIFKRHERHGSPAQERLYSPIFKRHERHGSPVQQRMDTPIFKRHERHGSPRCRCYECS